MAVSRRLCFVLLSRTFSSDWLFLRMHGIDASRQSPSRGRRRKKSSGGGGGGGPGGRRTQKEIKEKRGEQKILNGGSGRGGEGKGRQKGCVCSYNGHMSGKHQVLPMQRLALRLSPSVPKGLTIKNTNAKMKSLKTI